MNKPKVTVNIQNAAGETVQTIVPSLRTHTPVPRSVRSDAGYQPVSAIITCHNYAQFLPQCVDSLFSQIVPFAEIIIVDDASTDCTPGVCDELRGRYPTLRTERVDFQNVALARQAGAQLAISPLLAFVDADNWLGPHWLEQLLPLTLDPQAGVFFNVPWLVDEGGCIIGKPAWAQPFNYLVLRRQNHVDACAIIRRVALDQAGGWLPTPAGVGMEDWYLWLRTTHDGWQIAIEDVPQWYYRKHASSMSATHPRGHEQWQALAQQALHLAVVMPFCGRSWMLPRYPAVLRSIGWDPARTHGVFIDNSCDSGFGRDIRCLLQRVCRSWASLTIIPDPHQTSPDYTNAVFSNEAEPRIRHLRELSDTVCRLYARTAERHLGPGIDLVLTIEDDIQPLTNNLAPQLLRGLTYDAMACSGVVRSRFVRNGKTGWVIASKAATLVPYQHTMLEFEERATHLQEVDGTGMGCLLSRIEAWRRFLPRRLSVDDTDGKYWHDLAWGRDVRLAGWRWVLDWSVQTLHHKDDGTWV